MLKEFRVDKDESNHIGSIADNDVVVLPVIFLIVKGIAILSLIIFLVLDQHNLMRLVGKDQNIVAHDLQRCFVPFDEAFRFDVILVVVKRNRNDKNSQ